LTLAPSEVTKAHSRLWVKPSPTQGNPESIFFQHPPLFPHKTSRSRASKFDKLVHQEYVRCGGHSFRPLKGGRLPEPKFYTCSFWAWTRQPSSTNFGCM